MDLLRIKIPCLLTVSLMLFSCGGGSSGGSETSNTIALNTETNAETNTELETEVAIEEQEMTMQSLIAPSDFLFTSKQSVTVSISSPEHKAQRAFISVYDNYQQLPSGRYYPDGNTRTISGNLLEGEFEGSFISLNTKSTYLVELWLDDGQDALQKELSIIDNKLIW